MRIDLAGKEGPRAYLVDGISFSYSIKGIQIWNRNK